MISRTEQQRVVEAQQQHERWLQRSERGRAAGARRAQEAQRRREAARRRAAQWEASGSQSLIDGWRTQRPNADLSELRWLIEEQAKDAARTQIQSLMSFDRPAFGKNGLDIDDSDAVEVFQSEKEWWDPTFDNYVRMEAERNAALEWELETLNRGHGYDIREPVPYDWEVMERDKPLQERIARSTPGGRMHTEHHRMSSPRAKQRGMRVSGKVTSRKPKETR